MNLQKFTWFYLILPEFTWIYLNLPKFTWFYLILPDFTWFFLILPEKKRSREKNLKKYHATNKNKKKIKIPQPLLICIGPTIRIGRESWCLPYAEFFLQFTEFKLKAPPYSKTLYYSRIFTSRAPPPFRSIYNQDRGNSSHGKVALEKCKISIFFLLFFLLSIEAAILKGAI